MSDTAPPSAPASLTRPAMPTVGAILGSVLAGVITNRLHVTDATDVTAITAASSGVITALFHWLGARLRLSGL